jgi:hypothetical protein
MIPRKLTELMVAYAEERADKDKDWVTGMRLAHAILQACCDQAFYHRTRIDREKAVRTALERLRHEDQREHTKSTARV